MRDRELTIRGERSAGGNIQFVDQDVHVAKQADLGSRLGKFAPRRGQKVTLEHTLRVMMRKICLAAAARLHLRYCVLCVPSLLRNATCMLAA